MADCVTNEPGESLGTESPPPLSVLTSLGAPRSCSSRVVPTALHQGPSTALAGCSHCFPWSWATLPSRSSGRLSGVNTGSPVEF